MIMLIKQILDSDIANCYDALKNDVKLQAADDRFYSFLKKFPEDMKFDMERTVSEYMARVTRIAYLQGIVDFTRLYVVLKDNPETILQKYVDT